MAECCPGLEERLLGRNGNSWRRIPADRLRRGARDHHGLRERQRHFKISTVGKQDIVVLLEGPKSQLSEGRTGLPRAAATGTVDIGTIPHRRTVKGG